MNVGDFVLVTDISKQHLHGFLPDEVAEVTAKSVVVDGKFYILCKSTERNHVSTLLDTEVRKL